MESYCLVPDLVPQVNLRRGGAVPVPDFYSDLVRDDIPPGVFEGFSSRSIDNRRLRGRSFRTDFANLLMQARSEWPDHVSNIFVAPKGHDHAEDIRARIDDLRSDAADLQEPFLEQSAAYLSAFCEELAPASAPAIFRLGTGTLRAVWENRSAETQIGLQFLGDGFVQYVMLRRSRKRLLQALGVDSPQVARQLAGLLGVDRLWFRG